jgi:hypothetical protein
MVAVVLRVSSSKIGDISRIGVMVGVPGWTMSWSFACAVSMPLFFLPAVVVDDVGQRLCLNRVMSLMAATDPAT